MTTDVLLRLKPELALTLHSENYASGTYVGYGFTLRALSDKSCIIFNSWVRKSALTTKTADGFFTEYMAKPVLKPGLCPHLKFYTYFRNLFSFCNHR